MNRLNHNDTTTPSSNATSQMIGVKYSGTNPEAGFGSIGGVAITAAWDFDIAGNRETQVVNSATTTYAVNDINQYLTVDSGSLTYNSRGDLLTHGNWTLAYDAFGHLISATGTSGAVHKYFYDAGGTRVGKQLYGEDPVFSFHVGFDRIEDFDTSNGDVTSYIYELGIDRPLAMISDSGDISFFHQDVLGNVVALTNAAGAITQQYRYEVWGKPTVYDSSFIPQPSSFALSPFLFTAREYDQETGLYHYRARAYSPELGRFLQYDPIDFGGRDLNSFRYVSNRSLLHTDPSGKEILEINGQYLIISGATPHVDSGSDVPCCSKSVCKAACASAGAAGASYSCGFAIHPVWKALCVAAWAGARSLCISACDGCTEP